MGFTESFKPRTLTGARLVAHAALVLAERAYADGKAEDAAHLVDVAHRLFGAAMEQQNCPLPGYLSH